MTREVQSLAEDQPLLQAMQFLRQHKVRHIPVLADGRLVGVVTDRDVKRATPSALDPGQREVWERLVKETPLSRVMTRDPQTASEDMPLKEAVRQFVEDGIGCLPVLRGGELVGIVTARDLLGALVERLE